MIQAYPAYRLGCVMEEPLYEQGGAGSDWFWADILLRVWRPGRRAGWTGMQLGQGMDGAGQTLPPWAAV